MVAVVLKIHYSRKFQIISRDRCINMYFKNGKISIPYSELAYSSTTGKML